MSRFSRREWLKMAATSSVLGLLARDTEDALADAPPRTRLVLLMQANGVSQQKFWPSTEASLSGALSSPILDPILSTPLAKKTTIVKGLFNHAGGAGNGHDQGFAGLWTGRRTVGTFGDPWGAGISVDQILRRALPREVPFGSINCGVLAVDIPPLKDHRTSFSYLGERQPVPTETDPFRLYAQLFAPGDDPDRLKRRLAEQRSVLDFAAKDLARMQKTLGRRERDKLEIHATAVRDAERRLALLSARPVQGCGASWPSGALEPTTDVRSTDNVPALTTAMLDLVALAIGCNLTRIVTFPLMTGGNQWRYQWIGIDRNSHEDIAHRDDGKTQEITDLLVRIGRWNASNVAYLASALDAIPEGSGTVLDNTLIVWGNELATGQHGLDDIPVVMIGRAGGRLKTSGLVDRGPQTYHRLGCSVLNLMGVRAGGFGEEPTCGPIKGLV